MNKTAIHRKTKEKVEFVEHYITANFWEYYITTNKFNEDIVEALVMGAETEFGDVSIKEITPFVIAHSTNLDEILPPEGYEWSEYED